MRFLLILTLWFPIMATDFENEAEEDENDNRYASFVTQVPIAAVSDEIKKSNEKSISTRSSIPTNNFKNEQINFATPTITQPEIVLCHVALAILADARNLGIMIQRGSKMLGYDSFPLNVKLHEHINMQAQVLG